MVFGFKNSALYQMQDAACASYRQGPGKLKVMKFGVYLVPNDNLTLIF